MSRVSGDRPQKGQEKNAHLSIQQIVQIVGPMNKKTLCQRAKLRKFISSIKLPREKSYCDENKHKQLLTRLTSKKITKMSKSLKKKMRK